MRRAQHPNIESPTLSPLNESAKSLERVQRARQQFQNSGSRSHTIEQLPPAGALVRSDERVRTPKEGIHRDLSREKSDPSLKAFKSSINKMVEEGGRGNGREESDDEEELVVVKEDLKEGGSKTRKPDDDDTAGSKRSSAHSARSNKKK